MLPKLYLITNAAQAAAAGHTVVEVISEALDAGARLIQLREKQLSAAELHQRAAQLVPLARQHDAKLLINTDASVARDTGADGVHRPAAGPDVRAIRDTLGPDALVGVSTHSLAEAQIAEEQGADFVTLSPIFLTESKPGYGPALGLDELARVCEAVDVPVFALAGVTPERARACLRAGAYGVAVMGGVMRAEDVGEAVRAYLKSLPESAVY